ncbi:MAG TPA: hypothetical protein VL728_07305 [Cyclobacteriaceae bacterium]|nr:hypothetical protein [Cyclobacteriaceae bacterium]
MKKLTALLVLILFFQVGYSQGNLDVIKVPDPANPGETIDCNQRGSAKNGRTKNSQLAWIGNPEKNRWDIPDPSKVKTIRIEELIAKNADKKKFKSGTPVQVTAYVYDVKPGGVESCNCGTKAASFKDTHIELTPDDNKTSAEYRMVVEVTPRLRMIMNKQGTDWSTTTLKKEILGHTVTIQGWLFYDEIHEPQSFSTHPDGSGNWRASCWEIHPITSIEVVDATEDDMAAAGDDDEFESIRPTSGPIYRGTGGTSNPPEGPVNKSPGEILSIIILGALLGIVGQLIRVVVGLKKLKDTSVSKAHYEDQFDLKKLVMSIIYAGVIGLVAGALMAVDNLDKIWDKSTILAVIAAGYAGVDFIEGFLTKNMPDQGSPASATTHTKIVTPPKEGPIAQ